MAQLEWKSKLLKNGYDNVDAFHEEPSVATPLDALLPSASWLVTMSAYTRTPAAWQVLIMVCSSPGVPMRLVRLVKFTGWYMSHQPLARFDAAGGEICTAP